ncbi:uncharacterized protein BKA78DRAFT_102602 [Phyllosticta capitalensis]|uniref:uncharacterized protein n=1 Tax=Phyllosticta capitalensis TaxID=121624 RepID=UPI00312D382A
MRRRRRRSSSSRISNFEAGALLSQRQSIPVALLLGYFYLIAPTNYKRSRSIVSSSDTRTRLHLPASHPPSTQHPGHPFDNPPTRPAAAPYLPPSLPWFSAAAATAAPPPRCTQSTCPPTHLHVPSRLGIHVDTYMHDAASQRNAANARHMAAPHSERPASALCWCALCAAGCCVDGLGWVGKTRIVSCRACVSSGLALRTRTPSTRCWVLLSGVC